MRIAICTIQRNRANWLKEWFAFHKAVGFCKFYFFAHRCSDDTAQEIIRLKDFFDIEAFQMPDNVERPQLVAYKYIYEKFNHEFDWIAFIDGDEFLFPTVKNDIREALVEYEYKKMSALAVYWACFGSSNHITEPHGLITQNFTRRAPLSFLPNRHVKSIVRGRQGSLFETTANAHIFKTILGTRDELLRPIYTGLSDHEPSYEQFRINHYVCQSLEYFKNFKQNSGAADVNINAVRPDSWWVAHDRNEEHDNSLNHLEIKFHATYDQVGD